MIGVTSRIALALMLAGIAGTSHAANFAATPPNPAKFGDTGWQCTDNATNHKLAMKHGLGITPRFFNLVFAETPDSSVVYPITWSWGGDASGNPVTVELTTEAVVLNIYSGAPLHGTWNAINAQWSKVNQGCFRAFVTE